MAGLADHLTAVGAAKACRLNVTLTNSAFQVVLNSLKRRVIIDLDVLKHLFGVEMKIVFETLGAILDCRHKALSVKSVEVFLERLKQSRYPILRNLFRFWLI